MNGMTLTMMTQPMKSYEVIVNEYDGNTCQPTSPHNSQPSQEPTPNIDYHPLSYPPNFAKQ